MDKLFTKEEANVLTRVGFLEYYQLLKSSGLKRLDAYEKTEAMHMRVHSYGERKYSDFSSFIRLIKLITKIKKQRLVTKVERLQMEHRQHTGAVRV